MPTTQTSKSKSTQRLTVQYHHILDTLPDPKFDDLALLASFICKTPMAFISVLDSNGQRIQASVGSSPAWISPEQSLCHYTILHAEMLIVKDTLADERFLNHPLITDDPKIRFYAGVPLVTPDGYTLGTLCVVDHKPNDLNLEQIVALQALARQITIQFELRHVAYYLEQNNKLQAKLITDLGEALHYKKILSGTIPICASCKKIRDDEGAWQQIEIYISQHSCADFTHGVCPDCLQNLYPEFSTRQT